MDLTMTLSLPRHTSTVTCSRAVLAALLSLAGTTAECCEELAVIMTEACTNAVVHSSADSAVDISVTVESRRCTLEVGNEGDAAGAKIIRRPDDALRVGGWGLPLIVALADTVVFLPAAPGQVRLRVTKHLPSGPDSPDR